MSAIGTEELIDELKSYGINIFSTGGETADVGDLVRTIIVDSTVTARIKRSNVIDNSKIKPGDQPEHCITNFFRSVVIYFNSTFYNKNFSIF